MTLRRKIAKSSAWREKILRSFSQPNWTTKMRPRHWNYNSVTTSSWLTESSISRSLWRSKLWRRLKFSRSKIKSSQTLWKQQLRVRSRKVQCSKKSRWRSRLSERVSQSSKPSSTRINHSWNNTRRSRKMRTWLSRRNLMILCSRIRNYKWNLKMDKPGIINWI